MKKIYMIAGIARSGKDTVSNYIKKIYEKEGIKAVVLQISEPLKYYAKKILGWNGTDNTKPREFLQNTGDIVRKQNPCFLIERLISDIKVLFNYVDVIIVSDVRLPFEFEEVNKIFEGTVNILVTRSNFCNDLTNEEKKHITENALNDFHNYHYIIENDSSLKDLEKKVESIVREENV